MKNPDTNSTDPRRYFRVGVYLTERELAYLDRRRAVLGGISRSQAVLADVKPRWFEQGYSGVAPGEEDGA